MKEILAGPAPHLRQLAIAAHNAIADSALGLAFEGSSHIAPPGQQAFHDRLAAIGREVDDALSGDQPAAPFLLVDGNAANGFHRSAGERVRGGKADGDLQELVVEWDAGCNFAAGEGYFNLHGLIRVGLRGGPVADRLELGSEYQRGDLSKISQQEECQIEGRLKLTYFSVQASTAVVD